MRSTFFIIFNTYINITSKEIDVEDKSLEKSLKRANSGGTHHLLKTKFLNLENDIYKFELEFSKQCLNPFNTVQGGMITSAIDEITSISVNIFTKDKFLPSSTAILAAIVDLPTPPFALDIAIIFLTFGILFLTNWLLGEILSLKSLFKFAFFASI